MNRPERVLWILDYFPRPHDMTTGVWGLQTVLALKQLGMDVVVLAPTPWIPAALAFTKTLRSWSSVPSEGEIEGTPVFYPKCLHYPHRIITRNLYHHFPFLDSRLVWLGCEETVSRIMERYPFQLVHGNFIFPSGFIGREIKRRWGVPLVVHERSLTRLLAARNHPLRRRLYAGVIRDADAVITINEKMARIIEEVAGNGCRAEVIGDGGEPVQVDVISSAGCTPEAAQFGAMRPGRYAGEKVILCVGAFLERKGQAYLIRAMQRLRERFPAARCILIGRGVCEQRLRDLTRDLDLEDRVEFWGQRPHSEVLSAMSWCDLFVLPSWDEPFGTVYGEAMAFGKPIIACRDEGIAEIVQDGEQGLLVPPRDEESLARAIARLLEDESLAGRFGRAAKTLAEARLNYPFVASRLIEVYAKSVSNSVGAR